MSLFLKSLVFLKDWRCFKKEELIVREW